jgi:hypothetical protein
MEIKGTAPMCYGVAFRDALWKWRVAVLKSQTSITAVNAGRESRKRENVGCVAKRVPGWCPSSVEERKVKPSRRNEIKRQKAGVY